MLFDVNVIYLNLILSLKIVKVRNVNRSSGYASRKDNQLLVVLLHCINQPLEMQLFVIKLVNANVTSLNAREQINAKQPKVNVSQTRLFPADGVLLRKKEKILFVIRV